MLAEIQLLYQERGLQILGPAMDPPETVAELASQLNIPYPVFAGDTQIIQAMEALGDRIGALPYSVLIDRSGTITLQHSGELEREQLIAAIESAL